VSTTALANITTCMTVIAVTLAVAVVILAILHHLACTDRRHAERRAAAMERQRDQARDRIQELLSRARRAPGSAATQELPRFAPAQVRPPGTALVVAPTEARMPARTR
jgi:hypothetical protein